MHAGWGNITPGAFPLAIRVFLSNMQASSNFYLRMGHIGFSAFCLKFFFKRTARILTVIYEEMRIFGVWTYFGLVVMSCISVLSGHFDIYVGQR